MDDRFFFKDTNTTNQKHGSNYLEPFAGHPDKSVVRSVSNYIIEEQKMKEVKTKLNSRIRLSSINEGCWESCDPIEARQSVWSPGQNSAATAKSAEAYRSLKYF